LERDPFMKSEKPIQILIEQCPHCKRKHTYPLIIQRVTVMGLSGNKEEQKTFTCVFTCPNTGEQFEAQVSLKKAPQENILSIQVESASL